jgi:hypothetical protein
MEIVELDGKLGCVSGVRGVVYDGGAAGGFRVKADWI